MVSDAAKPAVHVQHSVLTLSPIAEVRHLQNKGKKKPAEAGS
jgi:hypothetical protein